VSSTEKRIQKLAGHIDLPVFLCMWNRATVRLSVSADSRMLCFPQTEGTSVDLVRAKSALSLQKILRSDHRTSGAGVLLCNFVTEE
jgi:hypothetical protein